MQDDKGLFWPLRASIDLSSPPPRQAFSAAAAAAAAATLLLFAETRPDLLLSLPLFVIAAVSEQRDVCFSGAVGGGAGLAGFGAF